MMSYPREAEASNNMCVVRISAQPELTSKRSHLSVVASISTCMCGVVFCLLGIVNIAIGSGFIHTMLIAGAVLLSIGGLLLIGACASCFLLRSHLKRSAPQRACTQQPVAVRPSFSNGYTQQATSSLQPTTTIYHTPQNYFHSNVCPSLSTNNVSQPIGRYGLPTFHVESVHQEATSACPEAEEQSFPSFDPPTYKECFGTE